LPIWSCRKESLEGSSILSDQQQRKLDDQTCCDGVVEPSVLQLAIFWKRHCLIQSSIWWCAMNNQFWPNCCCMWSATRDLCKRPSCVCCSLPNHRAMFSSRTQSWARWCVRRARFIRGTSSFRRSAKSCSLTRETSRNLVSTIYLSFSSYFSCSCTL